MATRILEQIVSTDKRIIVVDAAVLIDAKWDKFCHEVWTAMIPAEEAVKRAMERDNLTEELVGFVSSNEVIYGDLGKRSRKRSTD
jgi:phosphopantetheine adenylyltransferase/dephospho-CoA kinase